MKLIIPLIVLTTLVLVWVLWGRAWLKRQSWAWSQRFFTWIEPVEILLWGKSETVMWSRYLMLLGALPVVLDQLSLFNTPELIGLVPEQYRAWLMLTFTVMGIISEIQRRLSTKPLAIVAVPDNPPVEVAVAIAQAQSAEDMAVAVAAADIAKKGE